MSIAGASRVALGRDHRIERRHRRRLSRQTAVQLVGVAGWCVAFVVLGLLVAAGFYGLLVSA